MKLINKQNFFPTVCVIFTLLVLGKIVLEAAADGIFAGYQKNLLTMFFLSLAATFVLGQYALLTGIVMLVTWVSSFFEPICENGYRDMFLSFTVPYMIGAAVYYASLFYETRRINKEIEEIRRYQNDQYDESKN